MDQNSVTRLGMVTMRRMQGPGLHHRRAEMNKKQLDFGTKYGCRLYSWPVHEHKAASAKFIPHGAASGYRRTGVEQIEQCSCGATRHVWITTFKVEAGAWDTALGSIVS